MELPEEEKALLIDAVSNINGGLGLLSQQLDTALNSLEPIDDILIKMGNHELNDRLNKASKEFGDVREQIKSLYEHARRALSVTDSIGKGVYG
jgi:hypothetical protein